MEHTQSSNDKDKGYAWVVCIACCLGSAISEGVAQAYGVLVPDILHQSQMGMATVTLAGTLHIGTCKAPENGRAGQ